MFFSRAMLGRSALGGFLLAVVGTASGCPTVPLCAACEYHAASYRLSSSSPNADERIVSATMTTEVTHQRCPYRDQDPDEPCNAVATFDVRCKTLSLDGGTARIDALPNGFSPGAQGRATVSVVLEGPAGRRKVDLPVQIGEVTTTDPTEGERAPCGGRVRPSVTKGARQPSVVAERAVVGEP